MPVSKSEIYVRVEFLNGIEEIDISCISQSIWQSENEDAFPNIEVKQMSLSNYMELEQMQ